MIKWVKLINHFFFFFPPFFPFFPFFFFFGLFFFINALRSSAISVDMCSFIFNWWTCLPAATAIRNLLAPKWYKWYNYFHHKSHWILNHKHPMCYSFSLLHKSIQSNPYLHFLMRISYQQYLFFLIYYFLLDLWTIDRHLYSVVDFLIIWVSLD